MSRMRSSRRSEKSAAWHQFSMVAAAAVAAAAVGIPEPLIGRQERAGLPHELPHITIPHWSLAGATAYPMTSGGFVASPPHGPVDPQPPRVISSSRRP